MKNSNITQTVFILILQETISLWVISSNLSGESRTGYVQIIGIEGDVYTILTDFGNVLDCNSLELTNMYEPICLTDFDGTTVHGPHMSVEERWNKQQELLTEAKSRLICMGYFKEDGV